MSVIFPGGIISGARPSVTFGSAGASGAGGGNPKTIALPSFTGEHPTRYLVVTLFALFSTTGAINSVTIGGISATPLVAADHTTNSRGVTQLWGAAVPTGVSGNVVITANINMGQVIAGVYALNNLLSTTPHATNFENTVSGTASIDVNVNVPAAGVCIAAGSSWLTSTATPISAASFTGVTQDFSSLSSSLYRLAAGSFTANAAVSPLAIAITGMVNGSNSGNKCGVAASWR